MSREAIASEIDRTQDAIEKVTGIRPAYFRPPHGGVLAGVWLRTKRSVSAKAAGLAAAGACAVVLGLGWGRSFPINKHIYSSPFAVFACGAAAGLLAVTYWLVDARGRKSWARPFETLGAYALFAYCGSSLGEALLDAGGLRHSLLAWLAGPMGAEHAALAWALCWMLFWFGVVKRVAGETEKVKALLR